MPRSVYALLLVAVLVAACDKVRDPRPATVRIRTYQAGQPKDCWGMLFNDQGTQLQEFGVSEGRATVDKLFAGTYVVRFRGFEKNEYPAEVEFKLFEAGELDLEIDLDKPGQAALRPKAPPP